MANNGDPSLIPNTHEPSKPLTVITFNNSIKLTPTNYLAWKTQIEAILIGSDLYKFIDGSAACPPPTITTGSTTTPNPAYSTWVRQDKLIFGALVGTLTPTLVPLISQASTSRSVWQTLASTYANPSRGHINQLKDRLSNIIKSPTQSITEYMQSIKACTDQLALLGKPIDSEDIIEKVLKGLDYEVFKPIIDAVNARDTPILFEELHEKLINLELTIKNQQTANNLSFPATVHATQTRFLNQNRNSRPMNDGLLPAPQPGSSSLRLPRKYEGTCQWCRTRGHYASQCPVFKQLFPNITFPSGQTTSPSNRSNRQSRVPPTGNQAPQAHAATTTFAPHSSNKGIK